MGYCTGIVVFCVLAGLATSGEHCTMERTNYIYGHRYFVSTWCKNGCCGTYPNETCCTSNPYVTIWIIVGCGIGGVLIISAIVACICCTDRRKRPGQVIQPPGAAPVYPAGPISTVAIPMQAIPTTYTYPQAAYLGNMTTIPHKPPRYEDI